MDIPDNHEWLHCVLPYLAHEPGNVEQAFWAAHVLACGWRPGIPAEEVLSPATRELLMHRWRRVFS